MERIKIEASVREGIGKEIAKKIRRLVREREAKRAIDAKVRADRQRVIRDLGWDLPMGSTKQRRRNTSTKSRDK